MTFLCFWFGCKRGKPFRFISGREWLATYECKRCGARTTLTDKGDDNRG